jgi:hypothetical protein
MLWCTTHCALCNTLVPPPLLLLLLLLLSAVMFVLHAAA